MAHTDVISTLQDRSPAVTRRMSAVKKFAVSKPIGALSAVTIVLLIVVAVCAPVLAPRDPLRSYSDAVFAHPNRHYIFGGDNVGRDVFSRVIYGARVSLWVGFTSALIGITLASIIGLTSGFVGGKVDVVIQRIVDVFMAFPSLILLLMIVAVFGSGMRNVIISIAIFLAVAPSRVIRSAVLVERNKQYVLAEQALGASPLRILVRHVLINVLPVVIVSASISIGAAILIEASLSFLGLGVPPPAISWGRMIGGDARSFFIVAPWLAIFPGIALSLTIFSFNMLGDALRDLLDPQLRNR